MNGREIVLTIEIKSNPEALDVHSTSYSIILLPAVNDRENVYGISGEQDSPARRACSTFVYGGQTMLFRGHGSVPSEVNDSYTAPPQAQLLTVKQHDMCEVRVYKFKVWLEW